MKTNEINNEQNEIKNNEGVIDRNYLKCKTSKNLSNFQKFKTIRSFVETIISGEITMRLMKNKAIF